MANNIEYLIEHEYLPKTKYKNLQTIQEINDIFFKFPSAMNDF